MFEEAIENMSRRAAELGKSTDDYIGEDGLIHCGKCGGQKQVVLDTCYGVKKVNCICPCMAKEYNDRKEKEKEEKHRRHIENLRKKSGIFGNLANATFENFVQNDSNRQLLNLAREYVDDFDTRKDKGQGLLFYGNIGTGKTYLACCIGNALLESGHKVCFTTISDLIQGRNYYTGYNRDSENITKDTVRNADLLIIDELDDKNRSQKENDILYAVINDRYNSGKPMIITTNLFIEEIKQISSSAIQRQFDRILQRCTPVQFNGKSTRGIYH